MIACLIVAGSSLLGNAAEKKDAQMQIDNLVNALPKFAVPMREVGDRFQNMYFAAEGGNWGLAFYMSKYLGKAMNLAKITKPNEFPEFQSFYKKEFASLNKAIEAEDLTAFKKEYTKVTKSCNECHTTFGYKFLKVVHLSAPVDPGLDYKLSSKASDVPD